MADGAVAAGAGAVAAADLQRVHFEIFGKVQGVHFRKYTQEQALRLGLGGWIRNNRSGSVEGEVEGPAEVVAAMRRWLEKSGSPRSRIDRAVFRVVAGAKDPFSTFEIRK